MFPLWPLSPIAVCFIYVIPSTALCPLYCPQSLYGPLSSLWPSVSSTASAPSKALCPLFSPLSPSTIFCTIYVPMSPLWSSAPYGPLLPLRRSVQPLRPSILSMTLCFLNSPLSSLQPLSPLWTSVSSRALFPLYALCPLYCPLSPLQLFTPL
jgi:hypothetical protein